MVVFQAHATHVEEVDVHKTQPALFGVREARTLGITVFTSDTSPIVKHLTLADSYVSAGILPTTTLADGPTKLGRLSKPSDCASSFEWSQAKANHGGYFRRGGVAARCKETLGGRWNSKYILGMTILASWNDAQDTYTTPKKRCA
jgi:hypothetical protein